MAARLQHPHILSVHDSGELPATAARNAYRPPYLQHQLARIYLLVGAPERALDVLEPLLRIPYILSPGWLRVDPTFDPLRSNPRFQRLAGGSERESP